MSNTDLPEAAWVTALLTLPGIGPKRLNALLESESAADAWQRIRAGGSIKIEGLSSERIASWRSAATSLDVADYWNSAQQLNMWMHLHGSNDYPTRLQADIEPPHLLFGLGAQIPVNPTVAIIGTRSCTSYGKRVAFEFGAALTEAGVSVVSGLALGIDAAAHEGALSVEGASPIGVVGSGLDVIYPKRNTALWHKVGERGTLVSETLQDSGP